MTLTFSAMTQPVPHATFPGGAPKLVAMQIVLASPRMRPCACNALIVITQGASGCAAGLIATIRKAIGHLGESIVRDAELTDPEPMSHRTRCRHSLPHARVQSPPNSNVISTRPGSTGHGGLECHPK